MAFDYLNEILNSPTIIILIIITSFSSVDIALYA
jgi:hypothetical protein